MVSASFISSRHALLRALAAVLAAVVGVALAPTGSAGAQSAEVRHPPIAYRACPQDECGLFVRDPSGTERRLTSNSEDRPEAWSPDGREIVYGRDPEEPGLFVIGADGSGQRQVSGDVAMNAAWSPDGQWIAFQRRPPGGAGPHELAVIPPDGSLGHVVTTGVSGFAWAPGGQRFAVTTPHSLPDGDPGVLQIVTVDGDIERTIPLAQPQPAGEPAWSPDGTHIAYGARDPEAGRFGEDHTYLVAADGTGTRQIGAADDQPHARSWSPAGTRLALERIFPESTSVIASEVGVVDAQEGSVLAHIAREDRTLHEPVWSVDGRRLYMRTQDLSAEPGRWLTVTDAQGQHATDLVTGGQHHVVGPAVGLCPQVAWYDVDRAPFTDRGDLPPVHRANVDCAVHHAIVRGFADGTYRPGLQVRRDQMATFVAGALEAAGVQLPEPGDDRFADVPSDSPHAEAIHRLAEAGVVHGGPQDLSDDSYGPGLRVRRDQMASFLVRAAEVATGQDLRSQTQRFADVPSANVHFTTVNGAAEHGLTLGFPDGTFRLDAAVSRAQTASFAVRLLSGFTADTGE